MKFQIIERKFPEEKIYPEKCFYWEKHDYYKIDNPFLKTESIGGTVKTATLNLMREIESAVGITVYVGLIAKEDTWFDTGTEAFEYDYGVTRISLAEYIEGIKYGYVTVRGTRTKTEDSESPSINIGEKYFDGETCSLDEFDVYFTTEPINTNGKES